MFKPRLRVPRGACLSRSFQPSAASSSSPFAVAVAANAAKHSRQQHQHQQQRSIHATPRRCKHSVPALNDGGKFSKDGVPGLYTAAGFNAAYDMYQGWCLDRLNELTQGTTLEGHTLKDIALVTSREPAQASTFNYASMAHNNHFFFDGLAVTGGEDPSEHMPSTLLADLEASFGSIETLQRELLLTADAMFGPGFVWLVRQADASGPQRYPYRVLTTYHAGSPYPAAHWRRQFADMNNQAGVSDRSGDVVREWFNLQNQAQGRAPMHGAAAVPGSAAAGMQPDAGRRSPGGADLVPVLCVNTWEHAWLLDWGVGGRWNYLAAWWNAVNWGKVAERASVLGAKQMTTGGRSAAAAAGGSSY